MSDALTAAFGKPFREAVAAFRLRLGNLVPTARWDDLWQTQHDRAFMVAGATKADLLADLADAVDKAISRGTSLEEFRRDFRRIVEERGWHGWTGEGTKAGEAWRTRVIYRTNIRTSYAAGRMAQLVEGGFKLWVYRHGGSVEPRIVHLGWDGLVLPPDHPFWATHAPPNGWGCSCYVVGARSFRGAQRLGGQPGKELPDGWQKLDPKTGAPVGIDRGWAYQPGASAVDDIIAAVKTKADRLPRPIESALMAEIAARREQEDAEAVGRLIRRAGTDDFNMRQILNLAAEADEPRLSLAEKAALIYYTTNEGYRAMNRNLREVAVGRGSMSDPLFRIGKIMDTALARLPRYEGPVSRGLRRATGNLRARIEALAPGDTVAFRGFTSTSITTPFGGPILIRIATRSGRRISHVSANPQEDEVLIGRGLQFRVVGHRFDGMRLVLDLEELPPELWVKTVTELMLDTSVG